MIRVRSIIDRPEVVLVKQDDQKLEFRLRGVDASVANALRRVMIAEVKTLAIDVVNVYENSSVLHDEFIAHRLGLLPICVKNMNIFRQMKDFYECSCMSGEGCPLCCLTIDLNVSNCKEKFTVTSSDLKLEGDEVEQNFHFLPGVKIVTLGPGQSLRLSARAILGNGKVHAKWSPVATAVFRYSPLITLNDRKLEDFTVSNKSEIVESCPRRVFQLSDDDHTIRIVNSQSCIFCLECIKTSDRLSSALPIRDTEPIISITDDPNTFLFSIESTGCLAPRVIVEDAISILLQKLTVLQKELMIHR